MRVALLARSPGVGGLRPLLRHRVLAHNQRTGLAGVRGRPARRLLAWLPPGATLARGDHGGQVRRYGRPGIPGGSSTADTGADLRHGPVTSREATGHRLQASARAQPEAWLAG